MKRTRAFVHLVLPIDVLNDSKASLVAQLESTCNAGDLGLIPGLGRSPGEGNGYPLQYSGLENPTDHIVLGVAKSQIRLSDFRFHFQMIQSRHYGGV